MHNIVSDNRQYLESVAQAIMNKAASNCYVLAHSLLEGLHEQALERASLKDRVISAAILMDKAHDIEVRRRPAAK